MGQELRRQPQLQRDGRHGVQALRRQELPGQETRLLQQPAHRPVGRLHDGGYFGRIVARTALLLLRANHLRLQGEIPDRRDGALRRFVELRRQPQVGLLPLGVGRLAYFGGALHGRSQELARQPENPRFVRFYRQRAGRQLPFPEQDRDQEESRIPDGRQPADLRRQTVAHPRRPDVGDGQHLRPGSGLGDAQRPAVDRGGHLPQEHDRHVRRRPRTSRRIR